MKLCPKCKVYLAKPVKQRDGYNLYQCTICDLLIYDPPDSDDAKQEKKSL